MAPIANMEPQRGGFDFSNVLRNKHLEAKESSHKFGSSSKLPKATSTGTTIVGCIFDDGVVIGADTRATEGEIVADKNCEKIHYISDNIKCAGAAAMISSNIQLHGLSTGKPPRVVTAMTMLKQYLFRYQGHVGAALVLGGYDVTGPQLFTIAPHGSTDKLPYVTMGSGSLAAMAVFETGWKAGLNRDEAIALVCDAIEAGIFNDLGSGSNVDVCVVEKNKSQMMRNYKRPNERANKDLNYVPRPGSTAVRKTDVWSLVEETEVIDLSVPTENLPGGMDIDS